MDPGLRRDDGFFSNPLGLWGASPGPELANIYLHARYYDSALGIFFIGNLLANGIGPTLPALLTDYVFKDPAMLRYAIAVVAGIAAPLSLVVLSFGMSAYRDSVQRAEDRLG